MKDYYGILGVSKNATKEEIKKAYRKLAHKYHPDKKGGDEDKFKEVNEAYQVLSDDNKKSQYDRFGRVDDGFSSQGFDFTQGFDFGQSGFSFNVEDLGDLFEEAFASRRSRRRRDPRRGNDIEVSIEMNLEDTLKKQSHKFNINKFVKCERCSGEGAEPGTAKNECVSCRGTGVVQEVKKTIFGAFTAEAVCPECEGDGQKPEKPCNVCRGEGRVKKNEEIFVEVPAGVDSNQILKVPGRGDAGKRGGRSGDLYVRILIRKHSFFQRKGDDLFATIFVPYSTAVLGGEVLVKDIEGKKLSVKVPAGTHSGKIVRISGKGITRFSGFGRGNLFLRMEISLPEKLTKKQKEILKSMAGEGL
ncbi:MAG: molecular chaperone DnaJ [Minisyncoccales bacterium]|jgi:molecular chaperone DnaJ